jgi:hypothetical protein
MISEFATELASAVERVTFERLLGVIAHGVPTGQLLRTRRQRPPATCYYPGCRNLAAPRFGMFCAALHKNLPRAEKQRYREQRPQR